MNHGAIAMSADACVLFSHVLYWLCGGQSGALFRWFMQHLIQHFASGYNEKREKSGQNYSTLDMLKRQAEDKWT